MNEKAFKGLIEASPQKRYKNFLSTVTDMETVWFLSSNIGIYECDINTEKHIPLWPKKEFCKCTNASDTVPASMDIHEFLDKCESGQLSNSFVIFPTDKDSYIVSAEQLCFDIHEFLDMIE